MKIIECQQGSAEWWEARRGVPTASEFGRILTPKTMALAAGADGYICELIGQRFQLGPQSTTFRFPSRSAEKGAEIEPEARRWYEMEANLDVVQVGFCMTDDERFGCSPDGLVGDEGGLELKCPEMHTHVRYLLDGKLPADYKAQVHGGLIVTGRSWWDFVSYAPGLRPLKLRIEPDGYTEKLRAGLEAFWNRYQALLAQIEGRDDTAEKLQESIRLLEESV